jgi:hypothetical protein
MAAVPHLASDSGEIACVEGDDDTDAREASLQSAKLW